MSDNECSICGGLDNLHTANCEVLSKEFGIPSTYHYNDGRRDGILLGLDNAAKVADLWGCYPMLTDAEVLLAKVIAEDIRKLKP